MTSETEFARRSLPDGVFGNGAGSEHDDVAWTHVDLGDDLVGDLVLDAAHFDRVLPGVGLHRDGEGLAGVPGVQPHRDGAAGAHALDAARGALDVGRDRCCGRP